jgi:hypothetical protein
MQPAGLVSGMAIATQRFNRSPPIVIKRSSKPAAHILTARSFEVDKLDPIPQKTGDKSIFCQTSHQEHRAGTTLACCHRE